MNREWPKSISLARSSAVTHTLPLLTSRWVSSRSRQNHSPRATSRANASLRDSGRWVSTYFLQIAEGRVVHHDVQQVGDWQANQILQDLQRLQSSGALLVSSATPRRSCQSMSTSVSMSRAVGLA